MNNRKNPSQKTSHPVDEASAAHENSSVEFSMGKQRLPFFSPLQRSFEACTAKFGTVILFGLIYIFLNIALYIGAAILSLPIDIAIAMTDGSFVFLAAGIFSRTILNYSIQAFVTLMAANFSLALLRKHESPINTLFDGFQKKILPLAMTHFLFAVAMAIGGLLNALVVAGNGNVVFALISLLFIVATIFVLLKLALTNLLIIDQDKSIVEAMKRSSVLMSGSRIMYVINVILLILISALLAGITCGVGILFILPFMSVAFAYFYLAIAGSKYAN